MAKSKELVPAVSDFAALQVAPDELRDVIEQNMQGQQVSALDLDRVSVPQGGGKFWTIPTVDGEQQAEEILGVIIYSRQARVYWAESELTGEPPDCMSDDALYGVGDPGGDCGQCEHARWGSDPKGGKGQACKQNRLVFLLQPKKVLPLVVKVPPTSLRSISQFLLRLSSEVIPACGVLSRFTLEPTKSSAGLPYSIIRCEVVERFDKEQTEHFKQFGASIRSLMDKVKAEPANGDQKEPF